MKSLIVIYIPLESTPKKKKGRRKCKEGFEKNKPEGSDILIISDPARSKVETEVFFNN